MDHTYRKQLELKQEALKTELSVHRHEQSKGVPGSAKRAEAAASELESLRLQLLELARQDKEVAAAKESDEAARRKRIRDSERKGGIFQHHAKPDTLNGRRIQLAERNQRAGLINSDKKDGA